MDTSDWKKLLLEREQTLLDVIDRCRVGEFGDPTVIEPTIVRLETLLNDVMELQKPLFEDIDDQSAIGQNSATPP